ncbi:MAG: hypothetical protein ACE5FZ_00690 [Nitrospiria bacterium]
MLKWNIFASRAFIYLFVLLSVLAVASIARADFTADQYITISHGEFGGQRRIMEAKVYSQGKKLRLETAMGGRKAINISRGDKNPPIMWTLMPNEKMYMETVGKEGEGNPMDPGSRAGVEKIFVTKEHVAGRLTNKFKLVWKDKDGSRLSGFAWELIELNNAPIRQEFFNKNEHVLVQLANIKVKRLDADLFEVPEGYRKISMPPQMPNSPPAPKRP